MQKHSDFNVGLRLVNVLRGLFSFTSIKANAEGEPPEPNTPPQSGINYEQLIAQARKEEKEKLYPQIEKLKSENSTLVGNQNKLLLENGELKTEIARLKEEKGSPDPKVAELDKRVKELEAENTKLKESTPKEEEIRAKIEAEYEIKMYAQQKLTENKGAILSHLAPSVKGSTKEEIDASIQEAIEMTSTIKKELGIESDEPDEVGKKKKKKDPEPNKPPRVPAATPSLDDEGDDYDADYIRNLDPSSQEYAEFRKKLGLK